MVKLGILLIIGAVLFMVVPLLFPDTLKPLAPLFCGPDETFVTETSTFSIPGETTTSFYHYCVDSEDQSHEVTGNVMLLTMGGFFVLLLGGMALIGLGVSRNSKRFVSRAAGDVVTALKSGQNYSVSVSSADAQEILDGNMMDWLNNIRKMTANGQQISLDDLKSKGFGSQTGSDKSTLTETLRQLEDARSQGLITESEYKSLRAEALDKLV